MEMVKLFLSPWIYVKRYHPTRCWVRASNKLFMRVLMFAIVFCVVLLPSLLGLR